MNIAAQRSESVSKYTSSLSNPVHRIPFNPSDKEHREAYRMLAEEGKQHPNLRFIVELPFLDAVTMMERKLALHAVKALGN